MAPTVQLGAAVGVCCQVHDIVIGTPTPITLPSISTASTIWNVPEVEGAQPILNPQAPPSSYSSSYSHSHSSAYSHERSRRETHMHSNSHDPPLVCRENASLF